MRSAVRVRTAIACAAAAAAAGCGGGLEDATVVIATDRGPVTLRVEIADAPEERRRGLMGRHSLPPDAGMLFVFPGEHRGGFWMKDTLVSLSIAFLDEAGRVLTTLDMEPCPGEPCPLYDPGIPYRAALEVNRGTFARLGVEAGDVVRVER